MNEVLRQRLWRHIESLPEEQVYQVLDYIEFLSSKYSRTAVRSPGSPLLRFGERLEDKMRAQGVALRAMRGADLRRRAAGAAPLDGAPRRDAHRHAR
jgi:uncharacterized membrane protein